MKLADKECVPAEAGTPPLGRNHVEKLLQELGGAWLLNEPGHLKCLFQFSDFKSSMAFANGVGDLAEAVGHHPDLLVGWGRCGIELWTHDIGGLCECDFILAARIQRLYKETQA